MNASTAHRTTSRTDARPDSTRPAPPNLDVVIRNRGQGQIIDLEVRGDWTEDAVEERLLKLIAIRQPAELHVSLSGDGGPPPDLRASRAALAEYGGTIVLEP